MSTLVSWILSHSAVGDWGGDSSDHLGKERGAILPHAACQGGRRFGNRRKHLRERKRATGTCSYLANELEVGRGKSRRVLNILVNWVTSMRIVLLNSLSGWNPGLIIVTRNLATDLVFTTALMLCDTERQRGSRSRQRLSCITGYVDAARLDLPKHLCSNGAHRWAEGLHTRLMSGSCWGKSMGWQRYTGSGSWTYRHHLANCHIARPQKNKKLPAVTLLLDSLLLWHLHFITFPSPFFQSRLTMRKG